MASMCSSCACWIQSKTLKSFRSKVVPYLRTPCSDRLRKDSMTLTTIESICKTSKRQRSQSSARVTCLVTFHTNFFLIRINFGPHKCKTRKKDPNVVHLKRSCPNSRSQGLCNKHTHRHSIQPLINIVCQTMIQQACEHSKHDDKT